MFSHPLPVEFLSYEIHIIAIVVCGFQWQLLYLFAVASRHVIRLFINIVTAVLYSVCAFVCPISALHVCLPQLVLYFHVEELPLPLLISVNGVTRLKAWIIAVGIQHNSTSGGGSQVNMAGALTRV